MTRRNLEALGDQRLSILSESMLPGSVHRCQSRGEGGGDCVWVACVHCFVGRAAERLSCAFACDSEVWSFQHPLRVGYVFGGLTLAQRGN